MASGRRGTVSVDRLSSQVQIDGQSVVLRGERIPRPAGNRTEGARDDAA
jgi:hypothetical protein